MEPTITSVTPPTGPSSGGDIVRIAGSGFGTDLVVWFGAVQGVVVSVHRDTVIVRTPEHEPGFTDIRLVGAGGSVVAVSAYRFLRPRIVKEAGVTRLIRTLLRELKRQVIENVSLTVSVEFDDSFADGLDIIALAELPSLVLTGPRITENRFYSSNEIREEAVVGPNGPEIVRRRPGYTIDLEFGITGASDRAVELLNLIAAVVTFLNRNPWITMPRDPDHPEVGTVRWEMAPTGELRTSPDGSTKDDVRAFTWGLVIRGFDIDEGLPFDVGRAVRDAGVDMSMFPHGEHQ